MILLAHVSPALRALSAGLFGHTVIDVETVSGSPNGSHKRSADLPGWLCKWSHGIGAKFLYTKKLAVRSKGRIRLLAVAAEAGLPHPQAIKPRSAGMPRWTMPGLPRRP